MERDERMSAAEVAYGNQRRRSDYPALLNLVRSYFHQDFEITTNENPDEVVAEYREVNDPMEVSAVVDEIHKFIALHGATDQELTDAFKATFSPENSFYRYQGRTTREGLLKIAELLS